MSKGLEALERISNHIEVSFDYSSDEDLSIVEKELKALKIIKKKDVPYWQLRYLESYEHYVIACYNSQRPQDLLTQEEYELLKEVLL